MFVLERYNRHYSTIFNTYKKWLLKMFFLKMCTGLIPNTEYLIESDLTLKPFQI